MFDKWINQDVGKGSNLNELQDLAPSVLGATDVPFYGNNQMLMQKVILGE